MTVKIVTDTGADIPADLLKELNITAVPLYIYFGDKAYKDRQKALKRLWGPPFRTITIHPLTFYFRLGDGNQIVEAIEHSYKPRRVLEKAYGEFVTISEPVKGDEAIRQAGVAGQPDEEIRPLPYGADTSTMALVTEYWRRS